jgi:hypothetical protein
MQDVGCWMFDVGSAHPPDNAEMQSPPTQPPAQRRRDSNSEFGIRNSEFPHPVSPPRRQWHQETKQVFPIPALEEAEETLGRSLFTLSPQKLVMRHACRVSEGGWAGGGGGLKTGTVEPTSANAHQCSAAAQRMRDDRSPRARSWRSGGPRTRAAVADRGWRALRTRV